MNNAKMWLVVSPTVGVPIFLGAVAVGSFAVHLQVVKNTTWVADFLQGSSSGGDEMAAATMLDEQSLQAAQVAYAVPGADGVEVTVVLPDGSTTQAFLMRPDAQSAGDFPAVITQ